MHIVESQDLILVNSIPISQADNVATNGVVHGISSVILPAKLLADCNCYPTSPTTLSTISTTPIPLANDQSLPERYVAGDAASLPPASTSSSPSERSTTASGQATVFRTSRPIPARRVTINSDRFLRRSPAANPNFIIVNESPEILSVNNEITPGTTSTTPFPYYNVWDDLVANHNLSVESGNQANQVTTSRPSDRPLYIRTRVPTSQPASSFYSSNENEFANQPPTPPPRFGVRRRIVARPTQRNNEANQNNNNNNNTYSPSNTGGETTNVNNERYGNVASSSSRDSSARVANTVDGRRIYPSVYYADEVTTFRPSTYRPPLVYRPLLFSSTTRATPGNDQSNTTPVPYGAANRPRYDPLATQAPPSYVTDGPNQVTRRPFLRRPVARPQSGAANYDVTTATGTSGGGQSAPVNCNPSDNECIRRSQRIGPQDRPSSAPSSIDPAFRADPGNVRSEVTYDVEPDNYGGSNRQRPSRPPSASSRPQRPLSPGGQPDIYSTEYYFHDLTTPSTVYFDSTRRPTNRNTNEWTSSTASSDFEDPDSPNYVRRYGSQRPPVASNTNNEQPASQPASGPNGSGPRYDRPVQPTRRPSYEPRSTASPRVNRVRPSARPTLPTETVTDTQGSSTPAPPAVDDINAISGILQDPGLFLDGKPVAFLMFRDLLRRANLANLSSSAKPITVFLPTDDAFGSLNDSDFDRLVKEPSTLQKILLRHIINYPVRPDDMSNGLTLRSISNDPIIITAFENGRVSRHEINLASVN